MVPSPASSNPYKDLPPPGPWPLCALRSSQYCLMANSGCGIWGGGRAGKYPLLHSGPLHHGLWWSSPLLPRCCPRAWGWVQVCLASQSLCKSTKQRVRAGDEAVGTGWSTLRVVLQPLPLERQRQARPATEQAPRPKDRQTDACHQNRWHI